MSEFFKDFSPFGKFVIVMAAILAPCITAYQIVELFSCR